MRSAALIGFLAADPPLIEVSLGVGATDHPVFGALISGEKADHPVFSPTSTDIEPITR